MGSVGDHLLLVFDIIFLYIWLETANGIVEGVFNENYGMQNRGCVDCMENMCGGVVFGLGSWAPNLVS